MTGIIELVIVGAVGAVLYGAHKTGALQKIYSGALGKVEELAERVKDPIVEMQLRHSKLVGHSEKIALLIREIGGKKSQLAVTKAAIEKELAPLISEYEKLLGEVKQRGANAIDAAEAQGLLIKKNIIELKRNTLSGVIARETELAERFDELREELSTINAQLELINQLIEAAKIDRDVLRLRGDEITGLLNGELNVDKLVKDINLQAARMEGEIEAAKTLKKDIQKTPAGTISLASLEL